MNYTPVNIKTWARLGQRGAFFGVAMPEIAEAKENLKMMTADVALLSGLERYMKHLPDKFLNVGIAEQNMIGIAAGLSMDGYCVFLTTYASFMVARVLEHIRQHLGYLQCNVKLVGSAAGVAMLKSGVAHWATEDLAFTRAIPNLTVFSPADSVEAIKVAEYCASTDGPMYVRLSGTLNCPVVYKTDYNFIPGKLIRLRAGKKIAIIATGLMVNEALRAADILEKDSIDCSVYDMHTIKPVDKEGLEEIFSKNDLVVTVEEHNIIGGMGSAVAEYKTTLSNMPRQVFIGVPDTFAHANAGTQKHLWEFFGLTGELIAERIRKEVQ